MSQISIGIKLAAVFASGFASANKQIAQTQSKLIEYQKTWYNVNTAYQKGILNTASANNAFNRMNIRGTEMPAMKK